MKSLFILFAVLALGQNQELNYSPHDCAFGPNNLPTVTQPCSEAYNDPSMAYPDLRYGYGGVALTYSIPANGPVLLTLNFSEPNKIASGQRVFTFRVDNQAPVSVDIFKLVGLKKKLDYTIPVIANGTINLVLTPQLGNAVLNGYQVKQLGVGLVPIVSYFTCSSDPNCDGIQYIEVQRLDGTLTRLWAVPVTVDFAFDPKKWTTVQP